MVDANAKLLEQKLDVYEKILSKQKYLAGDEFTLADLFHVPWGAKLPAAGIHAIEERPNVARSVVLFILVPPFDNISLEGGSRASQTVLLGKPSKMESCPLSRSSVHSSLSFRYL